MLLFRKRFFEGLTSGAITLTFRRWQKTHVRVGGRYRCHPIGVLEVDSLELITVQKITLRDARRAGFTSRAELLEHLAEFAPLGATTPVWRVELHHGGDGDRVELALVDQLTDEDIETIRGKLARLDGDGRWTKKTMALIDERPRVAASKLALELKRDKLELKEDIRKLKKLGLTQSFEVGYEISPRGQAYLAAVASAPKKRKSVQEGRTQRRGGAHGSR